jgi:DNA replication protein
MVNRIPAALDFHFLLLEYYKRLLIKEDELATLFMLDHLIQQGNDFVTPEMLSLVMNYPSKTLDEIFVRLINKGLLEYKNDKGVMKTSINPLRNRLLLEFQLDYEKSKERGEDIEIQGEMERVYHRFQIEFGRNLSPLEMQTIQTWFEYGYSAELIIDALETAVKKNRRSIKAVDKIILQKAIEIEMVQEGTSAHTETRRTNLASIVESTKKELDNE